MGFHMIAKALENFDFFFHLERFILNKNSFERKKTLINYLIFL